jgi:hypothetical protein
MKDQSTTNQIITRDMCRIKRKRTQWKDNFGWQDAPSFKVREQLPCPLSAMHTRPSFFYLIKYEIALTLYIYIIVVKRPKIPLI